MNFYNINTSTIGEATEEGMKTLLHCGDFNKRENQNKEDTCLEIGIIINVKNDSFDKYISKSALTGLKDINKYIDEFLDGTADNLGWKYTYHSLYSPFYSKVLDELKRNIYSRRAVIALGQGDINFSSDPPCLQTLMFSSDGEKLDMTAIFRSNDAVKAFPMNIVAISELHRKAANDVGLPIGQLHYIANNFHSYSADFSTLEKYVYMFETLPLERRFWSLEELEKEKNKCQKTEL